MELKDLSREELKTLINKEFHYKDCFVTIKDDIIISKIIVGAGKYNTFKVVELNITQNTTKIIIVDLLYFANKISIKEEDFEFLKFCFDEIKKFKDNCLKTCIDYVNCKCIKKDKTISDKK